jgi:hypothetical protein
MALPVRVSVSPDRLEAEPGDSFTIDVTVRNASDIVEHYEIETLGLPDGSVCEATPEVTKLRPGESGTATVRFTLPERPPAPAGSYILGVLARSRYRGEVSRCEELPLTIAPVHNVTVRVDPEVATGGRSARYTVEVANAGNTAVRLDLRASDPERRVDASFDPPQVDLLPGGTAQTVMTARAPRPWSREVQRRLAIEAAGAGVAGIGVAGYGAATLVQRPRFASRLTRFAGALAAVVTLAGAVLVAALIARPGDAAGNDPVSAPSATVPTPGGTASGGPSAAPSPSGSSPGPSMSASQPPSMSAGAPTAMAAPVAPRRIDLTRGAVTAGFLASDAFRQDGMLLSGLPDADGPAGCRLANAVTLRGDPADQRAVVAALPTDPAMCNQVPVQIRFVHPERSVRVTVRGQGVRRMEVVYRDLSRTIESGLSVVDDGRRGGIDYVLIRGLPADLTATPVPAAVATVSYTAAAG